MTPCPGTLSLLAQQLPHTLTFSEILVWICWHKALQRVCKPTSKKPGSTLILLRMHHAVSHGMQAFVAFSRYMGNQKLLELRWKFGQDRFGHFVFPARAIGKLKWRCAENGSWQERQSDIQYVCIVGPQYREAQLQEWGTVRKSEHGSDHRSKLRLGNSTADYSMLSSPLLCVLQGKDVLPGIISWGLPIEVERITCITLLRNQNTHNFIIILHQHFPDCPRILNSFLSHSVLKFNSNNWPPFCIQNEF